MCHELIEHDDLAAIVGREIAEYVDAFIEAGAFPTPLYAHKTLWIKSEVEALQAERKAGRWVGFLCADGSAITGAVIIRGDNALEEALAFRHLA